MAKKQVDKKTFKAWEKDAYHAFIEWPLFLARKIKQLERHIAAAEENLKQTDIKKGLK